VAWRGFGLTWLDLTWLGFDWRGLAWRGGTASEFYFSILARLCLARFGFGFCLLAWLGLAWLGLACLGVARLGVALA
jgi:hypothetical protein